VRKCNERSEALAHGKTSQRDSSRPVAAREASGTSDPDRLGEFESWLRRPGKGVQDFFRERGVRGLNVSFYT
jgi:hypothetical protein